MPERVAQAFQPGFQLEPRNNFATSVGLGATPSSDLLQFMVFGIAVEWLLEVRFITSQHPNLGELLVFGIVVEEVVRGQVHLLKWCM